MDGESNESGRDTQAKVPRSLVRKMAEVMGEVERVPKNGRNDFHKYDYATEADITSAVRKAMAARQLLWVPEVQKTEWVAVKTTSGKEERLCTQTVVFRVMDGESGESLTIGPILGQGQDSGDKATYKAMTGATKYALMKTFLIPTGDDPEHDGGAKHEPAKGVTGLKQALAALPAPAAKPSPRRVQNATPPAQEEPPPLGDADAPSEVNSSANAQGRVGSLTKRRHSAVKFRFGKSEGKNSFEVSDRDLQFYLKCAGESVSDPARARFRDQNEAELEQLEAEAAFRGL